MWSLMWALAALIKHEGHRGLNLIPEAKPPPSSISNPRLKAWFLVHLECGEILDEIANLAFLQNLSHGRHGRDHGAALPDVA